MDILSDDFISGFYSWWDNSQCKEYAYVVEHYGEEVARDVLFNSKDGRKRTKAEIKRKLSTLAGKKAKSHDNAPPKEETAKPGKRKTSAKQATTGAKRPEYEAIRKLYAALVEYVNIKTMLDSIVAEVEAKRPKGKTLEKKKHEIEEQNKEISLAWDGVFCAWGDVVQALGLDDDDDQEENAYEAGYKAGYDEGHKAGYAKGSLQGRL